MKVTISKKDSRCQLLCAREDGTFVTAELGPNLPYHDLAHYVTEQRLGLKKGFFGMISSGYSVSQLSDKDVIRSLGTESFVSEVVARALQSLFSGACSSAEFAELVNAELTQWSVPNLAIAPEVITEMLEEFQELVRRFAVLANGQSLVLDFHVRSDRLQPVTHEVLLPKRG